MSIRPDEARWNFIFLLPDLVFRDPDIGAGKAGWLSEAALGSNYVAIVAQSDHRVQAIRLRSASCAVILSGVTNVEGNSVAPAVLIARSDFPGRKKSSGDLIIAFRNAVALSCVLRNRARNRAGLGVLSQMLWTDVFDFHPTTVGANDFIYTSSPVGDTPHWPEPSFHAMQSPYVTATDVRLMPDRFLYWALGKEWHRRFIGRKRKDPFSARTFRSLEVAYRASSVGRVAIATIHDYGVQLGPWVSAIEILVWPTRQAANVDSVPAFLGQYQWSKPELKALRYRVSTKKNRNRRGNAVQKAYWYLNRARNDFLHGNEVSGRSLRTRQKPAAWLPRLVALVYRTVLVQHLDSRYGGRLRSSTDKQAYLAGVLDGADYEIALAAEFSRSRARR